MKLTTGKDKGIALDPMADEEIGPLPISVSGPTSAAFVDNSPLKEQTPENFICMKGPCIHYVEIVTKGSYADVPGSEETKEMNQFCRCIPGDSIELTDMFVLRCNQYMPISEAKLRKRVKK